MFLLVFLSLFIFGSTIMQTTGSILNKKAPDWEVNQWFQLPAGKNSLEISDFAGKVIYLYCFQSWCPGCHKYGFPTLQKILQKYGTDKDLAIIAVQTTFEGFSYNGIKQAKDVAEKYDLKIPIGQSGSSGKLSQLMKNYRTGGTPWTIIIDKEQIVRYNDFHITPEDAIQLINKLKQSLPGTDNSQL